MSDLPLSFAAERNECSKLSLSIAIGARRDKTGDEQSDGKKRETRGRYFWVAKCAPCLIFKVKRKISEVRRRRGKDFELIVNAGARGPLPIDRSLSFINQNDKDNCTGQ